MAFMTAAIDGGKAMNVLANAKLIAMTLIVFFGSSGQIPSKLLGSWIVGTPYDTNQPDGLNQAQTQQIEHLHIQYTRDHISVCGKNIPIHSVNMDTLTPDEFAEKYHFLPKRLGFNGSSVIEVNINFPDSSNVCGEYEDPGLTVYAGTDKHVVIEVDNAYFPLKKIQ
jgi:hypothetical protein